MCAFVAAWTRRKVSRVALVFGQQFERRLAVVVVVVDGLVVVVVGAGAVIGCARV